MVDEGWRRCQYQRRHRRRRVQLVLLLQLMQLMQVGVMVRQRQLGLGQHLGVCLGELHAKDLRQLRVKADTLRQRTHHATWKLTLIHDLLFLPISTIESAVGKRLITHCCVSRLACLRLSGHIEPRSPRLQA